MKDFHQERTFKFKGAKNKQECKTYVCVLLVSHNQAKVFVQSSIQITPIHLYIRSFLFITCLPSFPLCESVCPFNNLLHSFFLKPFVLILEGKKKSGNP